MQRQIVLAVIVAAVLTSGVNGTQESTAYRPAVEATVSAWAVRFMSWFLYDLGAYDPRVWSAAIATILGTAMIVTLLPSLRATRIDPVRALREE